MTLEQFKAWLEGYAEAIGPAPTPEQWAKVLAKLATVQAVPVSIPAPPWGAPRAGWGTLNVQAPNRLPAGAGNIAFESIYRPEEGAMS